MNRKISKIALVVAFVVLIMCCVYITFSNRQIYILSDATRIKTEQIQPIEEMIKVASTADTDVVFIDIETGSKYTIGYLTPGMVERIELEKDHWYSIEATGTITLGPVNVRVE